MSNAVLSVPGDTIRYEIGRTRITLSHDDTHYTLTVARDDVTDVNLSDIYTSEQIAREVARSYAKMFKAEQPTPPPASLAELAKQGTHRQVRPTMAGAHLAPLTAPQQRALAAAIDGVIYPGDGITTATLRSLDRKGYGSVAYEGRRKRVVSLVLNGRGLAAVSKAVA